jgi:hypothetical protein
MALDSSWVHTPLFRHTGARKFDAILWKDAMGGAPVSAMLEERHKSTQKRSRQVAEKVLSLG